MRWLRKSAGLARPRGLGRQRRNSGQREIEANGGIGKMNQEKMIYAHMGQSGSLSQPDSVNHPKHYTQGGIECIEAIEAALTPEEYRGFLKGQVMKYTWRMGLKDEPAQEAGKLLWYGERLKQFLEK